MQTIRRNSDIRVEVSSRVKREEIGPLLEQTLRYRKRKCGESRGDYFEYSRDKILCDLALMQRAEEMSRLVALYLRLGEELVAASHRFRALVRSTSATTSRASSTSSSSEPRSASCRVDWET